MTNKTIKSLIFCGFWASFSFAQKTIPLQDLSAFRPIQENWSIVGAARADLGQVNVTTTEPGTGVLHCQQELGKYGTNKDLLTQMEHGDLDLDLDFMMAKGSNSGIYLQGRYEIQLYDSWGKKSPKYNDCGGIYERWDESKPEGAKGYEGIPPRLNVAKAPGLWQNIKISFQAPRFDANGKKISNAKILSIVLNDVLIHENVEITGPTRGALGNDEVALGPIRFQGDHGNVAFRNIKYKSYNQKKLTFSDLKFGVYKGNFRTVEDIEKMKLSENGKVDALNWAVSNAENEFAVKYTGKINVPEAGKYTLTTVHGGNTQLKINGKEVFTNGWLYSGASRQAMIDLPAGQVDFEMYYWKSDGWLQPSLGLYAESETIRKHALHTANSALVSIPTSPILLPTAAEPVLLRSFMDIKEGDKNKRIVHAISVGNKENIHFTYNLDNGSMFQIWKGNYLNTTPMWNDRGDGSSKPLGSVLSLGDAATVGVLENMSQTWKNIDQAYRSRGYELDEQGQPTFKYELGGTKISDKIVPSEDAKAFNRVLTMSSITPQVFVRMATAKSISKVSDGLYLIGDGEYYIRCGSEITPQIRESNGQKELLVSGMEKINYSIVW